MFGIFKQLLDLIYKKRCYVCGSAKENTVLCEDCQKKIRFLPKRVVKTINNVDVYSMTIYTGIIMKLIRGLKYHGQKELAYFHAKLMYDYWKDLDVSNENYVILPVPMHKSREKKRGYNHMLLVAQEFSKLTGYTLIPDLVQRVKNTKPQYALTQKEREKNLEGAFKINTKNLKPIKAAKILIIDDIITTGSTISEIISSLRSADYHKVKAFTTSCSEYNII